MSETSSPQLWNRPDRKTSSLTTALRNGMSQPQEQHDQSPQNTCLVHEREGDPTAAHFEPFPEFFSRDSPFDHPTDESYTTVETAADSEEASPPSIDPTPFGYGLDSTAFPISNLDNGYILDMNFDPSSHYNYGAVGQESHKLLGLTLHNSHGFAALASHDNQLMSPQLTNTASPESSFGGPASPVERVRLLGGGPMSRISSQSTNTEAPASLCQNTPALTGCSAEASPEPVTSQNAQLMETAFFTSNRKHDLVGSASNFKRESVDQDLRPCHINGPIVRVEKYSRGDSPARTEGSTGRKTGKRSRSARSTSHLAAPSEFSSVDGTDHDEPEDEFLEHSRAGFNPVARAQISDPVPNFNDQEATACSNAVNGEVEEWLTKVSTVDFNVNRPAVLRKRAKSTSDGFVHISVGANAPSISGTRLAEANARIPGPGLYIQEDSEDDIGEELSVSDQEGASSGAATPSTRIRNLQRSGPEDTVENLSGSPWEDPIRLPSINSQIQPQTSQIAMTRFLRKAADIETASRKATWGTTVRRMSETDLERLLGPEGLLSRLSVGRDKIMEIVDRRGSMLASRLLPKRNPSTSRNRASETSIQDSDTASLGGPLEVLQSRKDSLHARKESQGERLDSNPRPSTNSMRRMTSNGKSKLLKSPKIHTGGAVAAIASQVAVIGANGSISPTATSSPTRGWNPARNMMRRKSRGETYRPTTENNESGLAALWTQQGGPPLPTLASPPQEKEIAGPFGPSNNTAGPNSDLVKKEQTVSIDFTPQSEGIIPTKEGFKINIQSVNPRILPFLAERLAREQLARYKKLVKFKIEHAETVRIGKCSSGNFCVQLGGQPSYPPSKVTKKDVEFSHTGFSQTTPSSAEEDCELSSEGLVVASQFPEGVPMPPVVRLPAEFECPLCFTVKKIQKPSDWSKHVHEDLQPFTCTFAECNEPKPKSFKRKADWVRHENERHRQLEWWTCNKPDCQHKCYRRDNFVQHLVREHKLADPNVKPARSNKPAVRGPGKKMRVNDNALIVASDDEVLKMVTECRSDTTSQPQSEACRFCGNVSNSWKKLTVHLAKHMEQISIPILSLVKEREVSPETVISPIDQQYSQPTLGLRTRDRKLAQERLTMPMKSDNGFNSALSDLAPPLHGHRHHNYLRPQTQLSSPSHLHNPGQLFPSSRFDGDSSIWPEPNQDPSVQAHTSRLGLDQSTSGTFNPMYSSAEPPEQPGFTPINMLPTSSATFHDLTGYNGSIHLMANGRPMSFTGNTGFDRGPLQLQNQDPTYHPQFNQHPFSASEPQSIRQDDSLMSQYRNSSSTPFQQPLNFEPSVSPQVPHFYHYST